MKLVSIDYIPGEEIVEALGIVKGQIVQSKNIGRDFLAGMRSIVGGEISDFNLTILVDTVQVTRILNSSDYVSC